jgi:hypothetical protein
MMEVMMQNPAMQQLLLSRLPPHMQKPEVLRAMMANQEVRARIAAIAQQSVRYLITYQVWSSSSTSSSIMERALCRAGAPALNPCSMARSANVACCMRLAPASGMQTQQQRAYPTPQQQQ